MKFRFPVVIIDEDFRSENASGLGIRALARAIEAEGLEVLGVTSYGDLSSFAQQQSRACAFVLSIDDEEFRTPEEARRGRSQACARSSRRSASATPTSRSSCTARRAPRATSRTTSCAQLHGFIHMFEDTPEFVARYIVREARPTSTAWRRRSSARWCTTRTTARTRGTARGTPAASPS